MCENEEDYEQYNYKPTVKAVIKYRVSYFISIIRKFANIIIKKYSFKFVNKYEYEKILLNSEKLKNISKFFKIQSDPQYVDITSGQGVVVNRYCKSIDYSININPKKILESFGIVIPENSKITFIND
ncbi:MAG: hypothetical protein ACP5M6_03760 [Methanobrevibacter sp.]